MNVLQYYNYERGSVIDGHITREMQIAEHW